MPLFKLKTFKHCNAYGAEVWENVYTILTANVAGVEANAAAIIALEKAVSYDEVSFDGYEITASPAGAALARDRSYMGQGALVSAGLGSLVPLFNAVRVTFGNAVGRPEIKYLRLGAMTDNIELGKWSGEFRDFVDEFYTQPLAGNLEYVGPTGEAHVSGTTHAEIQMRQLGWHRRSRAGFKRGWVIA